jgi:2',3'-cyclic-nucleotide 2'-phosphodiesterase/3'-nucleotidase
METGTQIDRDGEGAAPRRGTLVRRLRVLSTTDLHSHLMPFDYFAARNAPGQGLARAAGLAARLAAEVARDGGAALLVDNGDFLQGAPLGDFVGLDRGLGPDEAHPMIAAMNAAGYAAATLGNHDFDYGLEFLEAALAGARFPVVSANAVLSLGATPLQDRTLVPPWVVIERQLRGPDGGLRPLRIGLIGLLPPQTAVWNAKHLDGRIRVRDMVETARARVPELREAGAEVVIALAHTGIGPEGAVPGMENAAVPLARVPGIDAVVAGHSHLVFPSPMFAGRAGLSGRRGTIHGRPTVMAGAWGTHLGVLDIDLVPGATGWRATGGRGVARSVGRRGGLVGAARAAPAVLAAAAPWHAETLAYLGRPLGRVRGPISSHFALVAPDPCMALIAAAQIEHAGLRLRGTPHEGLPVLAAVSPFKAGGRGGPGFYTVIPAGPLTMRDIADLYLYPNQFRALRLTGAEVIAWLERGAAQFARVPPGAQDAPLIDPDFPSHNFDVMHGLTYRIDLAAPSRHGPEGELADPAASRIRDVRLNGRLLDPRAEVIVATNDYRAAGGGRFPGAAPGRVVLAGVETNRAILAAWIAARGTVDPVAPEVWRFEPMPGTTAIFESAPAAVDMLPGLGRPDITPAGPGTAGFARFRIAL